MAVDGSVSFESLYSFLFEHAPGAIGIVELTEDGEIELVAANGALARAVGAEPATVPGVRPGRLRPNINEAWLEKYREAERTRRPVTFETSGLSGPALCVTVGYLGVSARNRPMFGAVSLDISARRLTEGELARTVERYRALLDGIPDSVARVDRMGRIVDVHIPPTRTPVMSREEALGRRLVDVAPAGASARVEQALAQALELGEVTTVELETTRHGRTVVLEWRFVRSGADEITVLQRDITQMRDLQRRLALSERLASLGTLAAGTAHEINNPLSYVSGNLDFALGLVQRLRDAQPPSTQSRRDLDRTLSALQDAQMGAAQIGRVVEDLKAFARPEDERRERVDVLELLDRTIAMTHNEVRHRAKLVRKYEQVPAVYADGARLGQVFVNLLTNAAQAIPLGDADRHVVGVEVRKEQDMVVVDVSDTGHGIERDVLPRIFDPFFTTKRLGEGMGIGLAVSHRLVTSMGGRVEVESTPNEGTRFRVLLPAAADVSSDPVPGPRIRTVAPRRKILIIDDEPFVTTVLGRLLADDNDVHVEHSARRALDAVLAGQRYDAILCDLAMPELDGMGFFEALLEAAPDQAPHTAFVTGGALSKRCEEFLRRCGQPVLPKPFRRDGVFAVVEQAALRTPG